MRTILFYSVLILSLSGFSQTVTFDWAKQMGGTGWDDGYSIVVDASGNIYTTGGFEATVDFDPGVGVHNLTSNGGDDIFIQKLDANGNFLWVKQMGGLTYYDVGRAIAIDASGHIYITGSFGDTVDFDPGVGVSILTSNGVEDVFIQKLDAIGNLLWAKQMGGSDYDRGTSIAIDASGSVYTTGYFRDTVDFDPGAAVYNLTSNGLKDIFIQKLDANGDFLWAKQMGGVDWDSGNSIAVDVSGNVYTTGSFQDKVDFDPGAGVINLTCFGSQEDIFIQKLDANGNFLWVKQMGGTGFQGGNSITLDASGHIYTTGLFSGIADFNPGVGLSYLTSNGAEDIFIQKLDANGDFLWARQIGGVWKDYGTSIATDIYGNIYTTGGFNNIVDFDPGADVSNLTSNGDNDIFIHKLDANGDFLWVKQMGGSGYYDVGSSIAIDAMGNVYTTGGFEATVDFNPGVGVNKLTSNGGADIFIQKLQAEGIGVIENDFGAEFLLYPNPTQGNFSIDLGENYSIISISVIDITGKLIQSMSYKDLQVLNLKLEEPAGIYFLILESAEKKAVVKLVKE